ncbi:phosphatidylglycerophosphatase A [Methylohalomonas lacus]|uniref:Phosphatidylglycerophosphatase A n=1 Tax=Methylohalomonas lacus TaxID=398773 RepID=A0AAE3HID5_9GAMM|nr:phosphatidylglycerophosphatase A [Methylohalomonas lacus]MCS3902869.1 phosphatidylglycerophosphatase A [Methylohalomonas lacus]
MSADIPAHCYRNPVNWLAWGFGSGLSPWAPGTCGTVVGVVVYMALMALPLGTYLLVVLLMAVFGVWLCTHTANQLGVHDHGSIVWDEIVGVLVALVAAPAGWLWILAGFCLFRLFDIWKPWPISWLDSHVEGGLGIMLDDLLAGVYAAVLLQITSLFLLT